MFPVSGMRSTIGLAVADVLPGSVAVRTNRVYGPVSSDR